MARSRKVKRGSLNKWEPRKYRQVLYTSEGEYEFIRQYHKEQAQATELPESCIKLPKIARQWEFAKNLDIPSKNKKSTGRKWSVDFVVHSAKLVIEIDGYGHHRSAKATADRHKQRELALLGYTVLRFSTGEVKKGEALKYVRKFIERG